MVINELKRVRRPDPDKVICPACTHDFVAIPENVQAELTRLRAINAELVKAMTRLADEKYWRDQSIMRGAFTAAVMVDIASAALSRAEQAKPETETCVWTWCCFGNWHTSCGYDWGGEDKPNTCPACGKRIEVEK